MKQITKSIYITCLAMVIFFQVGAQITISQPASGASLPVCNNYTLYYTYTGSFSTYVVVQVYQNNSSGAVVKTYSNVSGGYLSSNYSNSMSSAGLSPGTYQIKIYDYYNPSFYGWSGIFTIDNLNAPSTISLVQNWGSTFEISWANVSGISEYRVDVSTTSDFLNMLPSYNNRSASGSESCCFYVTGVSPGTTYYARVRSVNSCSTSPSSSTLTVYCSPPSAPTAAAASGISATTFVANWNSVPGITTYKVIVTKSGGTPITYTTNNASHYTVSSVSPLSNYSYKVRAVGCGESVDSNVISLNTTALGVPTLTNPGGDSDERWISWTTVAGAQFYHFQVSEQNNFSSLWHETETSGTSETFDADMCSTYFIRVRAKSATGDFGAFSTIFEFEASGLCRTGMKTFQGEEDDLISSLQEYNADRMVISYPNPAESYIRMDFPKNIDLTKSNFRVKDMIGQEILLPIKSFDGGVEFDTSHLRSGFYIVTIVQDKVKLHSKFIRK